MNQKDNKDQFKEKVKGTKEGKKEENISFPPTTTKPQPAVVSYQKDIKAMTDELKIKVQETKKDDKSEREDSSLSKSVERQISTASSTSQKSDKRRKSKKTKAPTVEPQVELPKPKVPEPIEEPISNDSILENSKRSSSKKLKSSLRIRDSNVALQNSFLLETQKIFDHSKIKSSYEVSHNSDGNATSASDTDPVDTNDTTDNKAEEEDQWTYL